jgi:hypothetical protein
MRFGHNIVVPEKSGTDKSVRLTVSKHEEKQRFRPHCPAPVLLLLKVIDSAFGRLHVAIGGSDSSASDALRAQRAVNPPPARQPMPPPAHVAIQAGDWNTFVASRANAIIVGTEEAALGVWTAMWPSLKKPIHWVEAERLSLPRRPAGTLILQGADALTASDQRGLFEWLEGDACATRILTTTRRPLFPLVEGGSFLEALYYRLNVVLLVLEARDAEAHQ